MTNLIHVLHIGKTGGTAIRHALKNVNQTEQGELVFHNHLTRLVDIPVGEKVVFFLREPLNRFYSSFYSRLRKGQPRYYSEWSPDEALAFESFANPLEIIDAATSGSAMLKSKAVGALRKIEHIKDHYDFWLDSCAYLSERSDDIFFVGFMESFENDFVRFTQELGLDNVPRLPTSQRDAHINPEYEKPRLSDEQRDFFNTWFESDLELFKFAKQEYGYDD